MVVHLGPGLGQVALRNKEFQLHRTAPNQGEHHQKDPDKDRPLDRVVAARFLRRPRLRQQIDAYDHA